MTTKNEDHSRKSWLINIRVDTALCIGDSGSGDALKDKTIVKDEAGNAYIPASTLKGVWRHACEQLARAIPGQKVCDSPKPESMCFDKHCIVCRLFGSPNLPSSVVVSDLKSDHPVTERSTRNGVTINRSRRVAEEKRLFTVETTPQNLGVIFRGFVRFRRELADEETQLLKAGLQFINALGGAKSTGLGWVSIDWLEQNIPQERYDITSSGADRVDIQVDVELESPLAAGGRKPVGRLTEVIPYVRGGLLRGALAETYIEDLGENLSQDKKFREVFLSDNKVLFTNCYPCRTEGYPHVIPMTAVTCKANPGFKNDKSSKENHGVFDTLLHKLAAESVDQFYNPRCPICGGRAEGFSGFYSDGYHSESLAVRPIARVAINRRRRAAEDELLYHIGVIAPLRWSSDRKDFEPTRLRGKMIVPSFLLEEVCDRMRNRVYKLGGGGSRGLGRVKISFAQLDRNENLEDRLTGFNDLFAKLRGAYRSLFGSGRNDDDMVYFTVGLESDAILRSSDGWQPTMVLDADQFREITGCRAHLELVRSFASYTYVGGWNGAWKLHKRTTLATRMGSVFVFRTKSIDDWYESLKQAEFEGIGERREEGFGQVYICNPFHFRGLEVDS